MATACPMGAGVDHEPPRGWSWRGRLGWLTVDDDHRFAPADGGGTEVTFVVTTRGFAAHLVGTPFARRYGRRLDAAIPRLVARLTPPGATP